jgi:mevalonate pyrophosphate decarboxylase
MCIKLAVLEQFDTTWIIDSTMRAMAELHSGADEKPMIHSNARSMVEMHSRSVSTPPPFHLV